MGVTPMNLTPDDDNLSADHDSLEKQLEQAHLLAIRKDYANALNLLQNLKKQYPQNVEVEELWKRVTQSAQEESAKRQNISSYRSRAPYRNSIGFFAWIIIAGFLFFGAFSNDLHAIHTILKFGLFAPDSVTINDTSQYGSYPLFSWTAPAYANYLLFTFSLVLAAFMVWLAMRDLMRTPPWVNLDQPDMSSDSYAARSAMRWLWWWWW